MFKCSECGRIFYTQPIVLVEFDSCYCCSVECADTYEILHQDLPKPPVEDNKQGDLFNSL